MDEPEEELYDSDWAATVEFRLGRLRLGIMADGAIAAVAIVLAYMGFKGVANLTQGLGQINEVTKALAGTVWPPDVQPVVAKPPTTMDRNGKIDETVVPPPTEVAEPKLGPESETSERIQGLIAADPISPADLAKGPKLDDIRVDPIMDKGDGT